MVPLKVSDTHCTLLLAAKPYGDFGRRSCAEGSNSTENEAIRPQKAGLGTAWTKLKGVFAARAPMYVIVHARNCGRPARKRERPSAVKKR